MEGASTGPTAGVRKGLREYFANHEGNVLTREHLIQWLKQLALATSKKEIWDTSERIAEYMVDVKGYHTGEDYCHHCHAGGEGSLCRRATWYNADVVPHGACNV